MTEQDWFTAADLQTLLAGEAVPPVVLTAHPAASADGDPAAAAPPDQRRVRLADLAEDVGVDVRADEAAHVVGAEHVGVEHCAILFATLL
jgi:hypothetical protein